MWAPVHNAPLIWFLMLALYFFACLYRTLPHLFFSLHFFLTYLLSYLSFPLRIDPISFQAGCRKRLLNLAFNFFVFILCCRLVLHFFWLVNAWFCCVKFSFFHTKPRDWLGETSQKWPILCWVGHKTTTQSINLWLWIGACLAALCYVVYFWYWYHCSKWHHCIVMCRLTPLLCRTRCVVS